MASTLNPTTFTVTIQEEQTVKGVKKVNSTKYSIPNVTNIDNRIVTCPNTTSISLFTIDAVVPEFPGAGTFISSSLKYSRISNLDDTYPILITVSGSQGTYTQTVPAYTSMFISNAQITASNANKFNTGSGVLTDSINAVFAYASGSNVDVEYVLINV
jgi:hypothetical protein